MGTNTPEDIRRNGKYYTPESLAEFLARPLIRDTTTSVFDPAYGDGALLLAADKVSREKGFYPFVQLYGCDKAPVNGLLQKIPTSQLVKENFFRYMPEEKFDVILMNPPYVRHHFITENDRSKYQRVTRQIIRIRSSSDLWAYFIIKSVTHLKKFGCLGAILPWSFLQAEYAQDVRAWLTKNFGKIRVLALRANYFDDCLERVVLLWLENYGANSKEISIGYSDQINHNVKYYKIEEISWVSPSVMISQGVDVEVILQAYMKDYGFRRFKDYACVKIGVVTGADDFFVIPEDRAKVLGLSKKYLVPILKSFREFSGLDMNGNKPTNMLLVLSRNNNEKIRRYLQTGLKNKYNLRSHALRRKPWYHVDPESVPDAFFPYRCSHTPFIMINSSMVQCTNSIHRVYFTESLSENQMKWIQISLLSIPGQLSLEAYSRVYGEGVLKIEPKSLVNAIIHKGKGKFSNRIYQEISELIISNQKQKAVEIATQVVNEALGIPSKLSNLARLTLAELQNRRLR